MGMIVTQEHIDRAKKIGACSSGLPAVGTDVGDITYSQAVWAENHNLLKPGELKMVFKSCGIKPRCKNLSLIAVLRSGYG